MAREAWSVEEVEATVADYLAMLVEFHSGQPLNKAEHNRRLRALLQGRSKAAVEFKHQNISAVLVEDGLDYLDGYLPAFNYQAALRDAVRAQLDLRPDVRALIQRVVEEPVAPRANAVAALLEEEPPPAAITKAARERYATPRRARVVDFDVVEAANRSLGTAGELAVVEHEHRRLWEGGHRHLAERVEHVAGTQGDGLGYDVLSFEPDGRERLIEVKTTRRASLTPFFLTRNEVDVSRERAEVYQLYRLYRFDRAPKLFVLRGDLTRVCLLEPTQFRAQVA